MDYLLNKLRAQVAVLKDVIKEYPTSTIDSAIRQIESRIKHVENENK